MDDKVELSDIVDPIDKYSKELVNSKLVGGVSNFII